MQAGPVGTNGEVNFAISELHQPGKQAQWAPTTELTSPNYNFAA